MFRFLPAIFTSAIIVSGCGLYTPDIQEFWGTPGNAAEKKKAIVFQVTCELRKALQILIKKDIGFSQAQGRKLDWLEKGWGADILLVLTIDEKSSLTPNVSFNTPLQNSVKVFAPNVMTSTAQSYSTTIGGQLSSEGYRQEKVHLFYSIDDLIGPEASLPSVDKISANKCLPPPSEATLFVESDLKVYEWLNSVVALQDTGQVDFRTKNPLATGGVLSDEIRFEIISSITLAPAKDGSLSTPQGFCLIRECFRRQIVVAASGLSPIVGMRV